MTPLALELEGFTVYRKHTVVEWAGADTGLFAVTGPTGAGKSTLLDAITYVLYGKTARLGGKGLAGLISPGAESLFARLTFRTARGVFRATRVAQRKAGSVGTEVRIEEASEGAQGGWRQLPESERVKDANLALEQIVGLDYDGFTRAVLLPQGAFDEFLRGDAGLRRQLLSSLLGLDKVERVQRLASARAAELKGELEAKRTLLVSEYGDVDEDAVKELEVAASELAAEVAQGEEAGRRLSTELDDLRATAATLGELAQVAQRRVRLDAEGDRIAEARAAAERGRRAASVVPQLERLEQARTRGRQAAEAVADRTAELAAAEERLAVHRSEAEALRRHATGEAERLAAVAGTLRQAAPLHEALVSRGGSLESSSMSREKQVPAAPLDDRQWGSWQTALSLIPPFERALQAERSALVALAKAQAEREVRQREVAAGEAALQARVAEGKKLKSLDEEAKEALERARRADLVAAVREGLSEGDPCPVCGGPLGAHAPSDHHGLLQQAAERAAATGKALQAAREEYERARLDHSRAEAALSSAAERVEAAGSALAAAREHVALTVRDLEVHGAAPSTVAHGPTPGPGAGTALSPAAGSYPAETPSQLREEIRSRMAAALEGHVAAVLELLASADVSLATYPELAGATSLVPLVAGVDARLAHARQRLTEQDTAERELVRAVELAAGKAQAAAEHEALFASDLEQAQAALAEAVAAAGFADREEAEAGVLRPAELTRLEELVRGHDQELRQLDQRRVELESALAARAALPQRPHGAAAMAPAEAAATAERLAVEAAERLREHSAAAAEQRQRLGSLTGRLEAARQRLKRSVELRREVSSIEGQHALYHQLNNDLHGHRFPEHLLTQVQQLLARRASAILQMVTDGRYDLRLDAGDYLVADAWADGELRSARTLSGGESFVASLALALALSDTLAGSSALGALFLDEGFGTLDRATLEAVTAVLESLTSEGRMVGVITHVPELSARLPARLVVTKGPNGSSVAWDS